MLLALFLQAALGPAFARSTLRPPANPSSRHLTSRQGTTSLSGTVSEETGAVIPAVRVTILNAATGFQRRTLTDDRGYFGIPLLSPGTYTLTAEMPGFATVTINDISLLTSVNTALDIVLLPKPLSETLTVKATGATDNVVGGDSKVDITSGAVKHSITNEQVVSLPVFTTTLGRNTLGILPFLLPGVSPTSASGTVQADSNRRGDEMSINGSRPSSISFNFEGGDNNDQEYNRAAAPFPNPDALQEFTVISNSYQADFGRSSGGIINAVVKSGTSQYSGTLRHYLINEALNARGFFDPRKPNDRVNTFGGQIGGPLKLPVFARALGRNTFFFFDYEGARAGHESSSTISVLSLAERQGDFSRLPAPSRPINPGTGFGFLGDRIPAARINPISLLYLQKYIPLPNLGDKQFTQLLPTEFQNDQLTGRLDWQMGEADNVMLTYFLNDSRVISGTDDLPVGSKSTGSTINQNLVLRETHTLSAHTVNQVTVGATRFLDNRRIDAPGASGVPPESLGFTGIHPQSPQSLGVPSLNLQNTDVTLITGGGSASAKTIWQVKDDLVHVRGAHTLAFGAETRGFVQSTFVGSNNGSFLFVTGYPFTSLNSAADFLLGLPYSYFQTSGGSRYPRQTAYFFYAMDNWRWRPNLTVRAGLRYELAPPYTEKHDQVSVFRPGSHSEKFPSAPEGVLFVGDPDPVLGRVPRGAYPTDKNNLAPRLGIAWSPEPEGGWRHLMLGKGATALRAGFGVIHDQPFGYSLSQASLTQPFSVTQNITINLMQLAGGSFANPFGSSLNPWPIPANQRVFTAIQTLQPFDPGFRTAYASQYNVTLQRELPSAMLLEVAYIGSNSFKLSRDRELNVAEVVHNASIVNIQARRLYPQLGRILSQESTGRGRYDSLQVNLRRRVKHGLGFDVSYVYGKALDNGSEAYTTGVTDPFRWGRSSFDRQQNFVLSFTYALPKPDLAGVAGWLLRDWRVSGITEWRTGQPIDISQNFDTTLTARVPSSLGNPDVADRFRTLDPRRHQSIDVDGVQREGNFFFDPNAFRVVPLRTSEGRAGTLGRNVFDGPRINLTSISVIRQIHIGDSQRLDLRSDVRNLFNRPHFLLGGLSLRADSPQFGQVVSAAPGRIVQLSLRYSF